MTFNAAFDDDASAPSASREIVPEATYAPPTLLVRSGADVLKFVLESLICGAGRVAQRRPPCRTLGAAGRRRSIRTASRRAGAATPIHVRV
jgi:hypothetical protein